jgi:hypothetical protein
MAVLMICYARSGGTLLNKCLGSLPSTVVLSEVNPLGGGWGESMDLSFDSVYEQAKNWYGISLEAKDFSGCIVELDRYCDDNGLNLIIRDWPYVNFSPHEYNNFKPPYKLLTLECIGGIIDLKIFLFVRDSIDVWISRGMPPVKEFFKNYLCYVKSILRLGVRIFRYEDFCTNPQVSMESLCNYCGIKYEDITKSYYYFNKVNGDVQVKSRGEESRKISLLPRKYIPYQIAVALNNSIDMRECNELLGYPPIYEISMKRILLNLIRGRK